MQRNTEFDVTMQSSVLEWGTVQSGLFRANNLESMSKCGLKIQNFRATVLATGCDDVRIESSMFYGKKNRPES